ncbi:MAG: phenylalanine--tRNA ligase subunit beta [Nitrospinota bacterium]
MFITYPWLEKIIDVTLSPAELAEKLTMAGLETSLVDTPDPKAHPEKILDVDLTPNRADCLSVKGIAREIAALTGCKIKKESFSLTETDIPASDFVAVSVSAPERCPTYSVRLIKDVTIAPSPKWLLELLQSVGIRPVNNVVDITNYILWYEGQPLHAFDYRLINGKDINVRLAKEKEKFVTLDGKERILSADDLLIAGKTEGIALAGVMGGANTEVDETTCDILLESALFEPSAILKTTRSLGLHTESSHRFARGVDPEGVRLALDRAASMISSLAGGKVCKGAVECTVKTPQRGPVLLRPERVNTLLGTDIPRKEIISILETLSLIVDSSEPTLAVTVPSFRQDIEREIDLVEEVARIYGYGNIDTTLPTGEIARPDHPNLIDLSKEIRHLLTAKGVSEALNYSFISSVDFFPYFEDKKKLPIELKNPISNEMTTMRQSLIPGLLKNMAFNQKRGTSYLSLFETGNIFIKENDKIEEKRILTIAISPSIKKGLWNKKKNDFYVLKGLLEAISEKLKIPAPMLVKLERSAIFHPGKSATVLINHRQAGRLGELHPDFISGYSLTQAPLVLELDLDLITSFTNEKIRYTPLSRFPVVHRDLSLTIDSSIDCGTLKNLIKERGGDILLGVHVFDIYEGEQIPQGKKSIACSVSFGSAERTLLEDEINSTYESIFSYLNEKTGSTLREGG